VSLRETAVDTGFGLGWTSLRALPESVVYRQFGAIAELTYRRDGRGVQRLRSNLSRVLGPDTPPAQLDEVTRAGVHSYLRYWCEVFRLPAMSRETVLDRVSFDGRDRLEAALTAGRGFILALPHSANWDLAGAWLIHLGHPFTTVAERLRPEQLFDRFVAFRESMGMEVIPLTGGERAPSAILAERLRAGGGLALLADRDLTTTGVRVQLFNEPARMPGGPVRLALDTGATLLPVSLWYDGPRTMRGRFHEPIVPSANGDDAVAEMTQQLADVFAGAISEHPADWHMLQRVWVADTSTRTGRP